MLGAVQQDCTTSGAVVVDLALSNWTDFATAFAWAKAVLEFGPQDELSGGFKASEVGP